GRPESFYAKRVHEADRQGDIHTHEAFKVGQYVTLAMDPHLSWDEKLKYFRHALKRHCVPPPYPDDDVWMFYQQLADLVRQNSGTTVATSPCGIPACPIKRLSTGIGCSF